MDSQVSNDQPQVVSADLVPGARLLTTAVTWPERARAAQVLDAAGYAAAVELRRGIVALADEAEALYRPRIAQAHALHKGLTGDLGKITKPLDEAKAIIDAALKAWAKAEEAARAQRERAAQVEAQRQADAERLELAVALDEEGKQFGDAALREDAEALLAAPPPAVAVRVESARPKGGPALPKRWFAAVADKAALVRFVAAHPQYLGLLDVNMPAANAQARSLKEALAIPGLTASWDYSVVDRRDR